MPSRAKCLELSRLPRAPTRLTKVNFRGTTPGSGINLITRHKAQYYPNEYVDPTHPLARASLQSRLHTAPHWYSPIIKFYAFPKALLMRPTTPWSAPYPHRPFPAPPPDPEARSTDVSLQIVAFKSHLVLAQHLRYKIKRRLREAIRLIVSRGASVAKSPAGWKVVFREEDIGAEKWIVPDWTYLAVPTSELYTLPFAEYVRLMRNALRHLSKEIRAFDEKVQEGITDWESYLSAYGRIKLEKERKARRAAKILRRRAHGQKTARFEWPKAEKAKVVKTHAVEKERVLRANNHRDIVRPPAKHRREGGSVPDAPVEASRTPDRRRRRASDSDVRQHADHVARLPPAPEPRRASITRLLDNDPIEEPDAAAAAVAARLQALRAASVERKQPTTAFQLSPTDEEKMRKRDARLKARAEVAHNAELAAPIPGAARPIRAIIPRQVLFPATSGPAGSISQTLGKAFSETEAEKAAAPEAPAPGSELSDAQKRRRVRKERRKMGDLSHLDSLYD